MPIERKRYEWPRFANKRDFPAWGVRHEWPALAPIPEPELEEVVRWNQVIIPGPVCEPAAEGDPPPDPFIILPSGPNSLSPWLEHHNVGAFSTAIWPTASMAFYIPFWVANTYVAVKMATHNGSVVSGNVDVGIYDSGGTRLVSSGSTAQAGTNVLQEYDIADTTLVAGQYYLALALDNITGQVFRNALSTLPQWLQAAGVFQQATAFALPATATFAEMTTNYLPWVGVSSRSLWV